MNASTFSPVRLFSLVAFPLAALLSFAACTGADDVVIGTDDQAIACTSDNDCPSNKPCVNGFCGGGSSATTSGSGMGGMGTSGATTGSGSCMSPQPEVCDGMDNDCDGMVDDNAACPNGGTCVGGACVANPMTTTGGGECMGGMLPQPEVCDGLDNDCNGAVDDNAACPNGTTCVGGACVANPMTTTGGGGCMGMPPQAEVCDGLDNDCNGVVDDNAACPNGTMCVGGACVANPMTTTGGGECMGGMLPQPEVCDGLDNDCNGVIDEGATCGVATCVNGACVTPPCASNADCVMGQQTCVAGVCLNSTACMTNAQCSPMQTCVNGFCKP